MGAIGASTEGGLVIRGWVRVSLEGGRSHAQHWVTATEYRVIGSVGGTGERAREWSLKGAGGGVEKRLRYLSCSYFFEALLFGFLYFFCWWLHCFFSAIGC